MANKNTVGNIPDSDRLIFALDVSTAGKAIELVRTLKSQVRIFKVGMELFFSGGWEVINQIAEEGKAEKVQIFLDLKLLDIPETVNRTLMVIQNHHKMVIFATIHSFNTGLDKISSIKDSLNFQIFAVPFVTNMDKSDLEEQGIGDSIKEYVSKQVVKAKSLGCDGVIASGLDVEIIKEKSDLLVITPGIRPKGTIVKDDDQKRVTTPREAILNGADYIVVGRPIKDADNPLKAAMKIQEEIRDALKEKNKSANSATIIDQDEPTAAVG